MKIILRLKEWAAILVAVVLGIPLPWEGKRKSNKKSPS